MHPASRPLRFCAAVLLRLALVGVLAALAGQLATGPAHAHPALVETVPGAGYAVTDPPEAVSVRFNEPVTPLADALTLQLADGTPVALDVTLSADGTGLRGRPAQKLDEGSYEVAYEVVALDGDLIEGTFPFGVATPVEAGSTAGGLSQDDPDQVQPGTAAPRALLFLGLALALGGIAGQAVVRRSTGRPSPVRPLVASGSLLALVGATVLLAQVAGLDLHRLRSGLSSSAPIQLVAAEAALLALAALTARRPSGVAVAAVALTAVVALEGIRAHPGEAVGSAGVALTLVHLAAAAVWLGALVHIVRVALAWRGTSFATWVAVGAYARLAIALFVLVVLTGTLSALLLLPTLDDWTGTTYGQVLLVKLAVFAAAVGAAVLARRRHRRVVDDGRQVLDRRQRPWALSSAAKAEAALLVVLVVVTAGLTSATPPRLVSQAALLPAPTGAVVRVAERTGQVSVAAVASRGRVELRAFAPGPEGSNEYELSATLEQPGGSQEELDLAGCGAGCWTAPVDWGQGLDELHLEVSAAEWTGGEVTLDVPWPPQPAAELLRTVQSVMGAQTAIRTTETVTSGFGPAPTTVSTRTGQEYFEDEPWSDGGVTDPVVYEADGERTLVFALPVLGYHFRLTLDEQDRVSAARVVTGKHLLQRQYSYPDE